VENGEWQGRGKGEGMDIGEVMENG